MSFYYIIILLSLFIDNMFSMDAPENDSGAFSFGSSTIQEEDKVSPRKSWQDVAQFFLEETIKDSTHAALRNLKQRLVAEKGYSEVYVEQSLKVEDRFFAAVKNTLKQKGWDGLKDGGQMIAQKEFDRYNAFK